MFAWPGMGKAIYQAILDNDYNLALVGLLVATLATIVGNLLADLAYAWVDPRVSIAGSRMTTTASPRPSACGCACCAIGWRRCRWYSWSSCSCCRSPRR